MKYVQALEQLFDTADNALQVQKFESLATLCERCLKGQQVLIDVKPPCKIFGDIHGQVIIFMDCINMCTRT